MLAGRYQNRMTVDARLDFPATGRNAEAILAVLRDALPARGLMLEIAAGSGQHARHFADALPTLDWQPTDLDPRHRLSIDAWCADMPNVHPAIPLDATDPAWPVTAADAVLCINMIHIAPWEAARGLLAGAGRILPAGAPLVLYGPFQLSGRHTAESNARFDASLRGQDPRWGVRDLDDVTAEAQAAGLGLDATHAMPANNLTVVYRKR